MFTDFSVPAVSILHPSDGDTLVSLGQLDISIEIQANDNKKIDHIDIFFDDSLIITLMEFPYTSSISDTLSGSHSITITAKAYDKGGNWKESDPVSIYIAAFEPHGFEEIGSYDTPGRAIDLQIIGNYAYIADYDGGLRIINISNPSSPSEVGYFYDNRTMVDVCIQGNYAYVASSSYQGLKIIDISNPSSPYQVGYLESPWDDSYGIAISDTLVYQNFRDRGFCVINVSTPSNPVEIGRLSISGDQGRLIKEGNFVYTVCEVGNKIINISDPTNPTEIGEFGDPFHYSNFINVAKSGNYIYTFEGVDMWIYDVSNPQNPIQINEYFLGYGNSGYGIDIIDTVAYVSYFNSPENHGGILAVKISDPSTPYIVAYAEFETAGNDVKVIGDYAYVASGSAGLRVFSLSQ
jgi:hypothetical protein